MKNFKGEIIIKPDNPTEESLLAIGNSIHQQLIGNQDYIYSNIGVYLGDDSVLVWFDDCEGEIPEIKFLLEVCKGKAW